MRIRPSAASFFLWPCCVLAVLLASSPGVACAQAEEALQAKVKAILERPVFAHSRFGIEFYSLDTGQVLYEYNSQQLFVPGSVTKLLTEGTALELLGPDYRFHTRIYGTGSIQKDGTLEGDLVLVASGDPNLSNRIQADGTLLFENIDHSYGGPLSKGLPGDTLLVIRDFAAQIAAKGIKRIRGSVLVDATLFPEGDRELGSGVVISPMMVNDNVVDVIVTPGDSTGAPAKLRISPQTSYLTIENQTKTGEKGSPSNVEYGSDTRNPDGTHTVRLVGNIAAGEPPFMQSYRVPEPSRFAAVVLTEALQERGIAASVVPSTSQPDFKTLSANYTPEHLIAEHVSLPLREEVKVTLKVSQNLHASMMPYALGALVGHKTGEDFDQAGFNLENQFLQKAGLDLGGAAQSDGGGGNAFFTPDFMTHYLVYLQQQKYFADFNHALPILGRDGSLFLTEVDSPAAGHVRAKSGTLVGYDALNKKFMLTGKGLAGYMETADHQRLAFALFLNMVSIPLGGLESIENVSGGALGEITTAAYGTKFGAGTRSH